ncbi:aldehyde dehydrogenase [Bacillus sp. T33-2]|nr:aldehyde dehydrogenase [Bacillus sp. T33-2]
METGNYRPLVNPYSGETIAEVADAGEEEVLLAIEAAHRAAPIMAGMEAFKRAEILERVAGFMKEEREACARLIATEAAKPIKVARAEVERTIMTYTFAAHEARRIHGETVPLDAAPGGEGRVAYTVKEPLGVIAAITPFNFPMNLVAHKVGPAIAAGNTVVLKPASQTPLSAYKIAEYFHRAGLPDGALNVVTGSGKTIGDMLTSDDRVKKVTFTGSPAVGKYIRERSGLKRVTLELGSNSAVVIDHDTDLTKCIPRVVAGAFAYQGQVCISVQRIFVHESLFEQFVSGLKQETEKLVIGDPLDEHTDVSAMITPGDVSRAKSWVDSAVANGAELIIGGAAEGPVLKPTILLNASPEDKVSCEEIFAPVVHINSFSDFDEALQEVNKSQFGLQAGVYTNDLNKALRAAKKLHVGGVMINDIPTFRVDHMPYGGVKMSGTGREGIKYAIEEMTELKLVSIKLD